MILQQPTIRQMVLSNRYMKLIRGTNICLSLLPFTWFIWLLYVGTYGILHFKEIPVYGRHPDPSSLGLDMFWLPVYGFFTNIYLFPLYCVFTIVLLISHFKNPKIKLRKIEIFIIMLPIVVLSICFGSSYLLPDFFEWIMD